MQTKNKNILLNSIFMTADKFRVLCLEVAFRYKL